MTHVGIINYGAGNFASVWNALVHLELDPVEVSAPADLARAGPVVLPGVGAFGAALDHLEAGAWIDALRELLAERTRPFLGICVGMQLLSAEGHEFGVRRGLGVTGGRVLPLAPGDALPVPHVGWNRVTVDGRCPLFADLGAAPCFYFVHSYAVVGAPAGTVVATCDYGGPVVAAVQRDHVFGVQFHPEKSQRDGLLLLRNFARCAA